MGIIYVSDGEYYVYEAIQPVRLTPLANWVKRGEDGHYVVKRLKDADKLLTANALVRMKAVGEKFKGRDYDRYFEWSDEKIYCSELVWKIYKYGLKVELGKLQKFSDFDLSHPAVREKLRERHGDSLPMNETIISPAQMFDCDKLITVSEN